jgi:VWFA-related protein
MALGSRITTTGTLMTGMLALALAAAPAMAQGGQQSIPDAPRPQALPDLNTVTPVSQALQPAPLAQAAPSADDKAAEAQAVKDNGGVAPTSKLPADAGKEATEDDDSGPVPMPAAPADSASVIRVHVNFVQLPVTVKDSKGKLYPGLTWRDFRVYENGVRKNLAYWSSDPFPISVALVVDQSVDFQTMEKVNTSLHALQGAFTPYDEIAVFTYNNGVTEQTTFTAAQSQRLAVVLDRSKTSGRDQVWYGGGPLSQTTYKNGFDVDPNTSPTHSAAGNQTLYPEKEFHTLNDAILTAAAALAKTQNNRRRIVYVISDGKEYGSKSKEKDVIKFLQAHKIEVYATLVGDSSEKGMGFVDRIHLPLTMRDNALPRYTAATGGQCDPEFRPKGIEESFAKISEEVRAQYTLGFYSNESVLDGKYRPLEVRVLRPNLEVISPKGYYPTASASSINVPETKAPTP